MSDIAGIAGNAVAAYQNALSTVSNNIANVATDGYSRQDVALTALPVTKAGNIFLGNGVIVDSVKRQYDAFVESNLRNTTSDLASQGPMVNYANRVVDVLGGSTMGLNTAFDQFFSSARALSSDTSSTVLRSSFLRDAQGVAQRFGQLSEQLDLIKTETQSSVDSIVDQMNTLTKQLAVVNGQLTKQLTEARQPPDLLDQRDLLLKQLSVFAHVNTAFSANGQVTVSLGPSINQDIVVSGTTALPIGSSENGGSSDKTTLLLDPYGKSTTLNGITSGTLAGLMAFQEQVLASSQSALDNLAQTFVNESNTIHTQGINAYGNPGQGLFSFDKGATSLASGMQVAFTDPMLVAAAAQFRVTEQANNTSGTDATLIYSPDAVASGPTSLTQVLVNNEHPSAARYFSVGRSVPVTAVATIPNGMSDVSIFLDTVQEGQQLQILTRDGRQLIGSSMADDGDLLGSLMTSDNGFAEGASYSDDYLNGVGQSYRSMTVFYGAQAQVQLQPIYNSNDQITGSKPFPALLQGTPVQDLSSGIAENALTLNGVSLGALADTASGAMDVAAWINELQDQTGVTATARNEISPAPQDLKLGMPLVINGVTITDATSATTVRALANAINASQAESGGTFTARVSPNGELMITNAAGYEGEDITISATSAVGSSAVNALGLPSKTYRGQVTLTQPLVDENGDAISKPIQLGFGSGGTPADLAKLGFRTGAYISGAAKDDLLVFVTGSGMASVSASYSGTPADPKQALRAQQIQVQFLPDTDPANPQYAYQIIDSASSTVLAERKLDPTQLSPGISYQGLQLSFTAVPKAGDEFTLDGNADGIGSNENMLAMNALETKAVIGKKTFSNAYIDHVNEMGNIARQATISQTALTVVHDQAVKSRDEVAGVSLDKEAGDLIRYQQAYQAAAKTLQVASQLFDSVLQIR